MGIQVDDRKHRAVDALLHVLPAGIEVLQETAGHLRDLVINGTVIEVKWLGEGNLADVRNYLAHAVPSAQTVVASRKLSPGGRALLHERCVSWVDETGAAEISLGSIVVSRTGRQSDRITPESRWTRSVLATAEALLCGVTATVSGVRDATGQSTGTCTKALKTLTQLELLGSSADRGPSSRRHIVDEGALLNGYLVANGSQRRPIELPLGVLWRDAVDGLAKIGERWTSTGTSWAASGAIAGAVVAPMLTSVDHAVVYLDTKTMAGLDAAARSADVQPIAGGRLTIRPFPTVTTLRLRSEVDGIWVAPWPRVYADLQDTGVRGEEAAEHLREVVSRDR